MKQHYARPLCGLALALTILGCAHDPATIEGGNQPSKDPGAARSQTQDLITASSQTQPRRPDGQLRVEEGRLIGIEYTVLQEDGAELTNNIGQTPVIYQQGESQFLPALQEALRGMKVDDRKRVTLPPEKTYGSVRPESFQEVELEQLPEDVRQAGATVVARDPAGNRRRVRVHEIKGDKAVVDFNHPFAGKTLTFDVRIVSVE